MTRDLPSGACAPNLAHALLLGGGGTEFPALNPERGDQGTEGLSEGVVRAWSADRHGQERGVEEARALLRDARL